MHLLTKTHHQKLRLNGHVARTRTINTLVNKPNESDTYSTIPVSHSQTVIAYNDVGAAAAIVQFYDPYYLVHYQLYDKIFCIFTPRTANM